MASLVFENKVKKWEQSRLAVRNSIANYDEQNEYFLELEQMAFLSVLKQKEMEERILSLKSFALAISGKESNLASDLNTFLPLCQTLYGDRDFKSTAKALHIAVQLIHATEEEEQRTKRINDQNKQRAEQERKQANSKQIIEKDAREWNELRKSLKDYLANYNIIAEPFLVIMFCVSGHFKINEESESHIRKMQLLSNQISGKEALLGSQLQKYAAISNKYLKDESKLNLFRSILKQKGHDKEIDQIFQLLNENKDSKDKYEKDKQKKYAEEQERKRKEAEERERRKREEAERARRQKQEAEGRERKRKEEARRTEGAKKARKRNKILFFIITAIAIAWGGNKYYKSQHRETMFNNQVLAGDNKLASKDYQSAIDEYRKAINIDSEKGDIIVQKIQKVQAEANEEFKVLLEELETILKADKKRFNEDSNKRLDRMLEIYPDNDKCKEYQKIRERQQKGKRY